MGPRRGTAAPEFYPFTFRVTDFGFHDQFQLLVIHGEDERKPGNGRRFIKSDRFEVAICLAKLRITIPFSKLLISRASFVESISIGILSLSKSSFLFVVVSFQFHAAPFAELIEADVCMIYSDSPP